MDAASGSINTIPIDPRDIGRQPMKNLVTVLPSMGKAESLCFGAEHSVRELHFELCTALS